MPHAVGGGKHRRRHERHEPGSLPHSEARTRGRRRNRGASGSTHRALVAGRRRRARVHGGGRRDGRAPRVDWEPRKRRRSRRVFRRIRFGPVTRRGASVGYGIAACNVRYDLLSLQGKAKRDPEGYRDDVRCSSSTRRAARAVHVEAPRRISRRSRILQPSWRRWPSRTRGTCPSSTGPSSSCWTRTTRAERACGEAAQRVDPAPIEARAPWATCSGSSSRCFGARINRRALRRVTRSDASRRPTRQQNETRRNAEPIGAEPRRSRRPHGRERRGGEEGAGGAHRAARRNAWNDAAR